jgi:hypothetical protein
MKVRFAVPGGFPGADYYGLNENISLFVID